MLAFSCSQFKLVFERHKTWQGLPEAEICWTEILYIKKLDLLFNAIVNYKIGTMLVTYINRLIIKYQSITWLALLTNPILSLVPGYCFAVICDSLVKKTHVSKIYQILLNNAHLKYLHYVHNFLICRNVQLVINKVLWAICSTLKHYLCMLNILLKCWKD